MPELPDVEIFKRIAENAVGEMIEEVDIRDRNFKDADKHHLKK